MIPQAHVSLITWPEKCQAAWHEGEAVAAFLIKYKRTVPLPVCMACVQVALVMTLQDDTWRKESA